MKLGSCKTLTILNADCPWWDGKIIVTLSFAMIDRPTIDRIMDAANIVDVVSEFVSLRKSGANYKGLCPFHDDRTPSFSVSPSRGIYKCFSCGKDHLVSELPGQGNRTQPSHHQSNDQGRPSAACDQRHPVSARPVLR